MMAHLAIILNRKGRSSGVKNGTLEVASLLAIMICGGISVCFADYSAEPKSVHPRKLLIYLYQN